MAACRVVIDVTWTEDRAKTWDAVEALAEGGMLLCISKPVRKVLVFPVANTGFVRESSQRYFGERDASCTHGIYKWNIQGLATAVVYGR